MFKDEVFDVVEILSDVRVEKYVSDQSSQTKKLQTSNALCQSSDKKTQEVQTDFEQILPQSTLIQIDNSKKLVDFIKSVEPLISEQLIANIRSHAFDDYVVDWNENEKLTEVVCKYSLKYSDLPSEKLVTSLTWNAVGSVIAAALGCGDHESWCIHQSFVCFWNIDRDSINFGRPDKIIENDVCITSLSFHPNESALIIGGDFSGKIYIWDLSQQDNYLICFSGKDEFSHQEPVSRVLWMKSKSSRSHKFVSSGLDGKICVWEFNQLKKELILNKCFLLPSNRMRTFKNSKSDSLLGITCVTQCPSDLSHILLGTENGSVFRCSIEFDISGKERKEYAATTSFEGHSVSVNSIDASQCVDDLFLTCSSDMTVRVYCLNKRKPIFIIEPTSKYLLSARWSLSRPAVFYLLSADGNFIIYDLLLNSVSADSTLLIQQEHLPVPSIALNNSQLDIFATGDFKGNIQIWSLPSIYVNEKNTEKLFFKEFEENE
uniref:WD repeat-containing protein 34 n=1 Tax=Hydra vulgaris TaxID=6087 RepID=T2M823_HYDVU